MRSSRVLIALVAADLPLETASISPAISPMIDKTALFASPIAVQ